MRAGFYSSLALSLGALPAGAFAIAWPPPWPGPWSLAPSQAELRLLFALALHLGASAAVALALRETLPSRFAAQRAIATLPFFALALSIPLLGALGLALVVVPALRRPPRPTSATPLRITRMPEPALGGGGEMGGDTSPLALGRSHAPAERLRAVMAARRLCDRLAVPLLAAALRDPADEVRLLAHAALGRRERAIYGRIQSLLARAEGGDTASHDEATRDQAMMNRQLAHEYWELAFLGLAEGEVLRHVLGRARHHAEAALARLPNDGALHLLLGRIHLRDGFLDGAERSFRRAAGCGLPPGAVVPWLAETAFRQRRLPDVRDLLRGLRTRNAPRQLGGGWR